MMSSFFLRSTTAWAVLTQAYIDDGGTLRGATNDQQTIRALSRENQTCSIVYNHHELGHVQLRDCLSQN
jgi:hypothetical protein